MNVLQLSAYDDRGGAAKAALRLHEALLAHQVRSRILVRRSFTGRSDVTVGTSVLTRLWRRLQRRAECMWLDQIVKPRAEFSPGIMPDCLATDVRRIGSDVLHLHWMGHAFLRLETLRRWKKMPIVWTMHDLWTFTGGCHYPGGCNRFMQQCGCCPLLRRPGSKDLSHRGWVRRRKAFEELNACFVSPSDWLAGEARKSTLLRDSDVRTIRYGLDLRRFQPMDRTALRRQLGLPAARLLILVGAADVRRNKRKGFSDFLEALNHWPETKHLNRPEIVLFGSEANGQLSLGGFRVHEMGTIESEDEMARLYAAADVYVAPSLEDNLPYGLIESFACGTPVVAYAIGGVPEIIDDGVNGALVSRGSVQELCSAIFRICSDEKIRQSWSSAAREKAEKAFDASLFARRYVALYEEVIRRRDDR